MGTFFDIQIVSDCSKSIDSNIWLNAQAKLNALESELSLYQRQSVLSRLRDHGRAGPISDDLVFLLKKSEEIRILTNGQFDIGYAVEASKRKIPKIIMINGERFVEGTPINMDGIAKGYAVDVIAKFLQTKGYDRYLVNFSGNMRWNGRRKDGQYWKISTWDANTQSLNFLPESAAGAVATSGNEHRPGHIIDPKTGNAVLAGKSVTIVGTSAMICDALSTAKFVGKYQGFAK